MGSESTKKMQTIQEEEEGEEREEEEEREVEKESLKEKARKTFEEDDKEGRED